MTMTNIQQKRIDYVSSQLAKHYSELNGNDPNEFVACACTGLSSVCIDCGIWWQMLLKSATYEQMENIFRLSIAATRINSEPVLV